MAKILIGKTHGMFTTGDFSRVGAFVRTKSRKFARLWKENKVETADGVVCPYSPDERVTNLTLCGRN